MQNLSYTIHSASGSTGLPPITISEAIKRGELPAIKSGRRYIILADDLRDWLRKAKERGVLPGRIDDAGRERLAELNRSRSKQAKA